MLGSGERITRAVTSQGAMHNQALVAMPPAPVATTLAATAIIDTAATLNATVNAQGTTTTVSFEYGLTSSYGFTVAATPASVSGTVITPASATLGALMPGTIYHFRVVATSASGTAKGADMTFTTSTDATLSGLALSDGTLYPALSNNCTSYAATVAYATDNVTLMPFCQNINAVITVNNIVTASGSASAPIPLATGNNTINIVVTATGGSNTRSYVLTVTRLPQTSPITPAADVPVTASDFVATGKTGAFALNHAAGAGSQPERGEQHRIQSDPRQVRQSRAVANGPFDLWRDRLCIMLANYHGGTGNDLVLQWANTRLAAWGANNYGQLGNNSTVNSNVPVPVDMTRRARGQNRGRVRHRILFTAWRCVRTAPWPPGGRTVTANWATAPVGTMVPGRWTRRARLPAGKSWRSPPGRSHCLALCADGTLATWGNNATGQLGNNSTTHSNVPVLVDQAGVLAGKTVIAIVAAGSHSAGAVFRRHPGRMGK